MLHILLFTAENTKSECSAAATTAAADAAETAGAAVTAAPGANPLSTNATHRRQSALSDPGSHQPTVEQVRR